MVTPRLAVAVLTLALIPTMNAYPGEWNVRPLTLDSYLTLTIQRMELTASAWEHGKDQPTDDLFKSLDQRYETTEDDYVAFGTANAHAITARLTADHQLADQIANLQTRILTAILAKER
jgi:hypothetical protein